MPGEGELAHRREDPHASVPVALCAVDEHGLREVHLAGERLEQLLRDLARIREDGELVAGQRAVGEDVGDDVAHGRH
jgi:hypothetical protein